MREDVTQKGRSLSLRLVHADVLHEPCRAQLAGDPPAHARKSQARAEGGLWPRKGI